jgi:hypothetical protein
MACWASTLILILAPQADPHAQRVAQEIRRLGREASIVDFRRVGSSPAVSLTFADGERRNWMSATAAGAQIRELRQPEAIWTRRLSLPQQMPAVLDPEYRQFAALEWRYLIEGMLLGLERDALVVNNLVSQRAAVKPYQLDVACRIGLPIPETLITSDPDDASAFIERHDGRVIHKTINSAPGPLLETKQWEEKDRHWLSSLPVSPTIFQKRIEGPADVRATVVGDAVFAALVESTTTSPHPDSRLDRDANVTTHDLPKKIIHGIKALMRELDLRFATVDFKVKSNGDLVFLELNPQGQFLYIEILTGLPISAAVAQLLCRHPRALPN